MMEFTQPHDPAALRGRVESSSASTRSRAPNLRKIHKAGVPMMTGTDTGFAVTPYGEWHARELEIFVDDLGFTPAEALRAATAVNARFLADGDKLGALEAGRTADFIALDGSPLKDISILLDKKRLKAVHLAGRKVEIEERSYDPRQVTDAALSNWTDVYTQARVAELRGNKPRKAAAE